MIRNFWIDCDIDGRETTLSGGPRAKYGEMSVSLRMRDNGGSKKVCNICCSVKGDKLVSNFHFVDGQMITVETVR